MRRPVSLTIWSLAALVWACALTPDTGRADAGRFIPWNDPRTPPLALANLGGRLHNLVDYRGKVVLVNFWATWCEPCRQEMPSMERLRERLSGRPFAVLGVNHGESPSRVEAFVKREAIAFPILLDPGQEATRAW